MSCCSKEVLVEEHKLFLEEGLEVHVGETFHSNEGCIDLIGHGSKSIISFLDSVCVRAGIEEEVFTSLLHTNIVDNEFFPPTKNIDKKDKFRVKHYARVVTYTTGTFIARNMDVRLPELEEVLFSSTHNTKCGLFYDTNATSTITAETSAATSAPQFFEEDEGFPTTGREQRTASMSRVDFMKQKFKDDGATTPPRPVSMVLHLSDADKAMLASGGMNPGASGTGSGRNSPSGTPNRQNKRTYTVAGSFVRSMHGLSKTLATTKCSFIRCIKPNATMTPGRFELPYVVDQLRCLGVVHTCEVLKAGMPTRIKIADLESMYRPLLPEKLQMILRHISEYGFVRAVMWAFQIPTDSYKIGRTRVFFRVGKISLLSELTAIDMDSDRGVWLADRLKSYVTRIWWRRALIKMLCDRAFVTLFSDIRARRCAVRLIQNKWYKVIHSEKKVRQKFIRRKWRVAILAVRCQLILLSDYSLIKESSAMRLKAEEDAEASIREMEALEEQYELTEQEEAAERASLGIIDEDILGEYSARGEVEDDDIPTTRRRSASSVQSAMNKVKTEMQALVAASSLATVSVCLFRWTKIKLFAAFETWAAVLPSRQRRGRQLSSMNRSDLSVEGDSANEASEAMSKVSLSSAAEIVQNQTTTNTAEIRSPSKPLKSGSIDVGGKSESAIKSNKADTQSLTTVPISGKASLASKEFLVPSSASLDNDVPEGKCFECADREAAVWCASCSVDYCKVCTQFVHECCKVMKSHHPIPLAEKQKALAALTVAVHPDDDDEAEGEDGDVPAALPITRPSKQSTVDGVVKVRRRKSILEQRKEAKEASEEPAPFVMNMARSSGGEEGKVKDPCAIKSCTHEATKGVSIRFCEHHYEEFRSSMKGGGGDGGDEEKTKTLQQQVALLKKQLQESGQQPVEFVELHVARERMQQAVQKLMGGDEAAEKDIERWDKAIRMNPEYQKEMEEKAKQWEIDQKPINYQCLLKMRSLIPPNVASTSMTQMIEDGLPKTIANRVWTKKCLWIINTHPEDTKKVHIADLQTKYGNQGLDIVEMRAIWYNMPEEFDNDGDGKKATWRTLFRQKLEELTVKEAANRLSNMEKRNPAYKGHEDLAVYDPHVEIERAAIQKSTAFDATEKPDISSNLGEGIKSLKKQMAGPEKPSMEGPLLYLAGGSGDVEGGQKVWVTLLLNKKMLCFFDKQSDADGESPTPKREFQFQATHTVKVGPGSRTFCVVDGDTEVLAFQSEKSRREGWVNACNDIVKLASSAVKIKKAKPAPAPEPVAEPEPERPKLGFLAGIGGGLKKRGGPPADGAEEAAPAKPSFLDAIAARKKKAPAADESSGSNAAATPTGPSAGGAGGGAPSFLEAIAARKKNTAGVDEQRPATSSSETGSANVSSASASAGALSSSGTEAPPPAPEPEKKPKKERKPRTGDV